ncbi:MAG TPA: Uma2 family endonuclease, partial [Thermoanaerobaculia bacterium]
MYRRDDARTTLDRPLPVPPEAREFGGFRAWAASRAFPEHGRVDFLDGDLEVDMSPEDLYTHGAVKAEIAASLQILVARAGRGSVFIDRGRLSSPEARLSAEPDVVVILWESVESGRVREIPARGGGRDRFIEIEGGADLVVEIVSDGSVTKDNRRLPALYAKAGVRELWRVDARGPEMRFEVLALEGDTYRAIEADRDGF